MDLTPLLRQCTSLYPPPGAWAVFMDAVQQYDIPPKEWWGILIDYIEESGQVPRDTWLRVLDQVTTTEEAHGPRRHSAREIAVKDLFHGLALNSYEYAVNLYVAWSADEDEVFKQIMTADTGYIGGPAHYELQRRAVNGMNSAHCHGGEHWERELEREKMEWLVGENGNLETKPLKYRVVERVNPDPGDAGVTAQQAESIVAHDPKASIIEDARLGDLLVRPYDGERFWWMEFAPEWLQGELEDEHPDAQFLTVYGGESSHELLLIEGEVWERVYDGAHTPEVECPNANWDPELREDAQGREVSLTDTYCGESPGEGCRYCGATLGEEHGVIYMGEGVEAVYAHTPEEDD